MLEPRCLCNSLQATSIPSSHQPPQPPNRLNHLNRLVPHPELPSFISDKYLVFFDPSCKVGNHVCVCSELLQGGGIGVREGYTAHAGLPSAFKHAGFGCLCFGAVLNLQNAPAHLNPQHLPAVSAANPGKRLDITKHDVPRDTAAVSGSGSGTFARLLKGCVLRTSRVDWICMSAAPGQPASCLLRH